MRFESVSSDYFDDCLFEADAAPLRAVTEELLELLPFGVEDVAGLARGGTRWRRPRS